MEMVHEPSAPAFPLTAPVLAFRPLPSHFPGTPVNIHEYQAKEILKRFGVAVPSGRMAETPEDARRVAEDLGGEVFAVKAQIHAGGRGKGGGIKIARSPEEVEHFAPSGTSVAMPQGGVGGYGPSGTCDTEPEGEEDLDHASP